MLKSAVEQLPLFPDDDPSLERRAMPIALRPMRVDLLDLWRLSRRERQVAELIAAAYKNPEIAVALEIKLNTVYTYVRSILNKSGLEDRIAVAVTLTTPTPVEDKSVLPFVRKKDMTNQS